MSDMAFDLGMKIITAAIEWISKQLGEDTATVRGRVLARLAKGSSDETDAVAESIAEAIRGASPK